ncbi:MAG: O-antigen ligase family protein [Burkholderiales bacterium]|jgi:O-antigen ligase|nr:O-antigen ligase family protein [Burkholderiales bacterium]
MRDQAVASPSNAERSLIGGPAWYLMAGPAVLLLVLPFAHTTALRMVALAASALAAALHWRHRRPAPSALMPAFGVWILAAAWSLLTAADFWYSAGEIKTEIGYGLVTFLCFYTLTESDRELRAWVAVLAVSFAVLVAYTLAAFVREGTLEFQGLHGGVLNYTTYLVMVLPVAAVLAANPCAPTRVRVAVGVLILLALVSAALTYSRMFWLSVIAGAVVLFIFHWRNQTTRRGRLVSIARLVGAILALLLMLAVVAEKRQFPIVGSLERVGVTLRTDPHFRVWSYGIDRIVESPLVGTGFGRMQQAAVYAAHFRNEELLVHAHNVFLDYGVQMGIPGIVALAFLFWSVGRQFTRLSASRAAACRLVGIAGTVAVVMVVVRNCTDDQFVRHNAMLFWALVGIGLGYGRRAEVPPTAVGSSTWS